MGVPELAPDEGDEQELKLVGEAEFALGVLYDDEPTAH